MRITARFYVNQITRHAGSDNVAVKLTPAYKDGANAEWAKYTPAGVIELSVNNAAAVAELTCAFDAKLDIAVTLEAIEPD